MNLPVEWITHLQGSIDTPGMPRFHRELSWRFRDSCQALLGSVPTRFLPQMFLWGPCYHLIKSCDIILTGNLIQSLRLNRKNHQRRIK